MRSRIVLILILLSGLWAVLLLRAAYLQIFPDGRLKALEKKQFETVVSLNPRRGDVIDRSGHELAVSTTTYSLFVDPKIVADPRALSKNLGKELKVSAKQIEEKIRQNRKKRFVWLQRRLDKATRDSIAELGERGLGFIEETERIYPNERLLAQVLGYVGSEGQGLEGLELRYNEHLQAARKKVSLRRDARGRPLIVNGQVFNQAPDGADVQLTIDRELQFILEQELAQAVRKHEADSAVGIVLDAQSSEILAMSSAPSFDPNRHAEFSPDRKRNRVVTDSFEPGSTMKTFLIAGAMSRGMLEPNTRFDTEGGSLQIGNRTIRESDTKHRWASLTVSEILLHSSNVGSAKIGFKMGDERLNETLRAFGFGEKLGVDLPGEAKGIVQPLPWRDHLLANVSFGHGITATPLQIANAYAAIANGGWLKQPYIVKSIRDPESGEVIETKPRTIRRVLGLDHVAKMRLMLMGATTGEGTGLSARVPGFPVAGKTGTAQKVNPNGRGYLKGGYISSFAGFLPANDPRFVILVAVDHPRKEYYGSAVAAPVFSRVAKFAVRRAGLAPVLITEGDVVPTAARIEGEKVAQSGSRPVDWSGGAAAAAKSDSRRGEDEIERRAELPRGPSGDAMVPDFAGLTLREVLNRVTGTDVVIKVRGKGFVTHTQPSAGARIPDGKEVTVIMTEEKH